ncbi:unnamed protein product [Lactuca saligna]|uniref:Small ribosomal subunit protein uS7 domain-containing protein n=1 Tax=Lactuca saligna TaxID=75948 RepID=A0AA35ZUN2_LACSI|nr:unnamed protein product [Lactuca saligna]
MPHTTGRYQARRFRKAQCLIVERLTNSLMIHGRNNDKNLMVAHIFKHAMEIIHLLTDANPIQIIVDAVINRLWIWSSQFKGEDNPCDWNDKILAASNTKIRVLTLDDGKNLLKFSTDTNVALLTARDPSDIPSICRVPAALQYPTGLEGSDAGLASIIYGILFKVAGLRSLCFEGLSQSYQSGAYQEGSCGKWSCIVKPCLSQSIRIRKSLILFEGGSRISASDGIRICDYVGIRIYDSIPLPNQQNLIISEGGTRINDYDRHGISDSDGTKTLKNSNENQNCKITF